MGVQGLLPLISPVSRVVALTDFSGKRIAIDGFVWLHRPRFHARELVKDPTTDRILPYLNTRLQRVLGCGVTPVIVFDGQSLPQKAATDAKRHRDRSEALAAALSMEARGQVSESWHFFQRAVEIGSETVLTWICELKRLRVEYIVAPYEADAELAFLARSGYVDAVLTEDGDLLAYQTPVTLFKLDDAMAATCVRYADVLDRLRLTPDQFAVMCCFAGCDYIEHISRMGIQTALKLIRRAGSGREMVAMLRVDGKFAVPDDYDAQLERAAMTFAAQKVYDPVNGILRNLAGVERDGDFLGADIAPDLLRQLVAGDVDTKTLRRLRPDPPTGKFSPHFPEKDEAKQLSPYFSKYKSKSSKAVRPDSNRKLTSYFKVLNH
jgi:exonuclease-1